MDQHGFPDGTLVVAKDAPVWIAGPTAENVTHDLVGWEGRVGRVANPPGGPAGHPLAEFNVYVAWDDGDGSVAHIWVAAKSIRALTTPEDIEEYLTSRTQ